MTIFFLECYCNRAMSIENTRPQVGRLEEDNLLWEGKDE
jgi:hypothetical protein